MFGIKSIIYENNNQSLVINVSDKNEIIYNNISVQVDSDLIFKYLEKFFRVIDSWKKEYFDYNVIDGSSWKLSIIYANGNNEEYCGKANYPNNFEAFERINNELIKEVRNG